MVGNTRRLYTRDSRPFCAAEVEDLSGMIEVTVWPELFERTQDLWFEGNILLLQVRARERGGRLQIAVQQVELYQPSDGAPIPFVPPSWLTKTHGDGETENGSRRAQRREPARRSAKAADPAPAAPKVEPPSPDPAPDPGPATPEHATAVATAARRALRIELRETEDEDADRDRLERVLDALRDFPGDDEVRLTVRTLDGGAQRVALPGARACPELTARLQAALSDAGEVAVVEG
jgi:hypothetical protein